MDFTAKLDLLMKRHGLTRGTLSDATGIPYNTIVGFYTKGYKNIKLSTLKRLADYFDVSLDVLCDDNRNLGKDMEAETSDLYKKYSSLSEKGRSIVDGVLDGLEGLESPDYGRRAELTYIREYVTPAAAGYASPAEGEDYVLIPRDEAVPDTADFAVRITGDSMEPYITDGSRVYVSRMTGLRDGDVGIFFVDGDMKCKQYVEDSFGNIYLMSANRARADADMYISSSSGMTVFCFGKVLLRSRPPLPKA